MIKPAIVVLHDQPDELTRLLTRRFGADYLVTAAKAGSQLAELMQELRVAVVLADREVGGEATLPFLTELRRRDPDVIRCLLSPIADRTTAQQLYKAIDAGSAERCLPAPWGHPDVGVYPQVSAMLSAWWCKTAPGTATAVQLTVVAPEDSSRLPEMRDLADRNNVTTRFLAPDTTEGRRILDRSGARATSVVVVAEGKPPLVDPAVSQIGGLVGARLQPDRSSCDVAVVGAGPAGLAAAVYAASEGLSTVVLEPRALGGQAGTSSAIRNYPGFPYGISGADLASRLAEQAWLLGAQTVYRAVTALRPGKGEHRLDLDGGSKLTAKAVMLATGVRYRQLQAPGIDRLRGLGVFHGAARAEAPGCAGRRVYVVGGGNSAGQAAVHLADHAATVTMLVRGDSLAATMSDYLVREIERTPNIALRLNSSVAAAHGSARLEALSIRTGHCTTLEDAAALFVMIGGEPDTAWLPASVARDPRGFVLTGAAVTPPRATPSLPYETSVGGVFAIGDVRQGSTKRVAAAVGEGAVSVASVHTRLARLTRRQVPSGSDDRGPSGVHRLAQATPAADLRA